MRHISTWEELAEVEENEKYRLNIELDNGCGWIVDKKNNRNNIYLSTHCFYRTGHEINTKMLQEHGFNVILDQWK